MRISEQTATFALYVIGLMVYMTVVGSVHCAVRIDSLYKAELRFFFKRLNNVFFNLILILLPISRSGMRLHSPFLLICDTKQHISPPTSLVFIYTERLQERIIYFIFLLAFLYKISFLNSHDYSYCIILLSNHSLDIKPLKTKRRPLYLKTQFVPRSKHFSSRL